MNYSLLILTKVSKMAFNKFKNINEIADKYQIRLVVQDWLTDIQPFKLDDWFMPSIKANLRFKKTMVSEAFLAEALIFPIFVQVLQHHPRLNFWSKEYRLHYDADLTGIPDYLINYMELEDSRDELKYPLLVIGEANPEGSGENFTEAWAQTLAEMYASQKINELNNFEVKTVYGIVTSGLLWEFGKLTGTIFTKASYPYAFLSQPEIVTGILNHIFTISTPRGKE